MSEPIKFYATVEKVQTMTDYGIRITLDMSEGNTMIMAMLAECKRMGVILDIEATPTVQDKATADTPDGKKARPAKLSARGA